MPLWNEINYETQMKIMSLIEDLLLKQTNESIQDGMVAAITELEIWSNSPCEVIESLSIEEDPFTAQASDIIFLDEPLTIKL